VCINDGAVMNAWADHQKCGRDGKDTMLNFLADPHGKLTDVMGMKLTHPGPLSLFGHARSKRYSALFDDGVLKVINVAEHPETDPAGDDNPANSLVEKMIESL